MIFETSIAYSVVVENFYRRSLILIISSTTVPLIPQPRQRTATTHDCISPIRHSPGTRIRKRQLVSRPDGSYGRLVTKFLIILFGNNGFKWRPGARRAVSETNHNSSPARCGRHENLSFRASGGKNMMEKAPSKRSDKGHSMHPGLIFARSKFVCLCVCVCVWCRAACG